MGLLEKSVNLGVGLFVYSRERVEELVEELVSKGEIAKKEAHQFASDLVKKGEEQREELKKLIQAEVREALNQAEVIRKGDLVTEETIRQIVKEELVKVLQEQGISKNENAG